MKKQLRTKNLVMIIALACISVFYISCKKNANTIADKNSDQDIGKAKAWYEALYNNKLLGTSVSSSGAVDNKDLSQLIKPDWTNPSVYRKFNSDVIEMSIDPTSTKLSSALKNGTTNQVISNKEYSRSSYILLNNGTNYQAYVMTLIADSSYVKNDPSKLANNTYKKRDADYSGLVLYFTPRGEYVNGYRYRNGKLINTKRKIAGGVVTNTAPVEGNCWYYYMIQYGPDGSAINYRYMYTICDGADGGYGGGGGGGEGTPPPCPGQSPTGPTSVRGGNAVNSEPVEGGDPGDGGGFPVPAPCGIPSIIEHKEEIINKITDPCLNNTISEALTSNKDVKGFLADVINRYAGKNNKIIINLNNGNINSPAQTNSNFDKETGMFSANITFKNGYFDDVSKEAVVASLVHEVVHAYLLETNSQYKSLPKSDQHNFMFQNFVKDIAGYLQTKYDMPSENAWGLAWSGIGDIYNSAADDTTFPTDQGSSMTKQQIAAATTPYNFVGNGSKGTPNCPPK